MDGVATLGLQPFDCSCHHLPSDATLTSRLDHSNAPKGTDFAFRITEYATVGFDDLKSYDLAVENGKNDGIGAGFIISHPILVYICNRLQNGRSILFGCDPKLQSPGGWGNGEADGIVFCRL